MTAICYVGIEISANLQKALLGIEVTMLLVLSIVALVKVGVGHAPPGHLTPSWTWFNPFDVPSPESFMVGFTLMLFIYWGWDTAVSVNEETKDRDKIPGSCRRHVDLHSAGHLRPRDLVDPVLRGHRHEGDRALESEQQRRRAQRAGDLHLRHLRLRHFLTKLLIFMVLSSAAASTQTTILPTARTTLSMAVFKAIPQHVRQDPQAVPDADRRRPLPWAGSRSFCTWS